MLCIEDSQSKAKRHLDSPPTIIRLLQINAKDEHCKNYKTRLGVTRVLLGGLSPG